MISSLLIFWHLPLSMKGDSEQEKDEQKETTSILVLIILNFQVEIWQEKNISTISNEFFIHSVGTCCSRKESLALMVKQEHHSLVLKWLNDAN